MYDVSHLFLDLGAILAIGCALAFVAKKLKQPGILAYILTGVIVGPQFLDMIASAEMVSIFSGFGIAFLLFTVGLELKIAGIRNVGGTALLIGIGQVLFTSTIGFLIMSALGYGILESVYVAVALTFSSTIIIIKLLSEKNDLNSLYGRLSVGLLIVQDIIAIFALIFISGMAQNIPIVELTVETTFKGALLLAGTFLFTKYGIKAVFDRVARSHELLFLSSIAYCFLFAFLTHFMGLSLEIGALLAGVSLATLKYNVDIVNKVHSLRDFFLTMFFVVLGMQLVVGSGAMLWQVALLSFFVLFGNPLIVMVLMGLKGYSRRTSLFTGMTVAQISEFSLILIALGLSLGQLSQEIASLVTLVGIVTITGSVYMIEYNDEVYRRIGGFLRVFERKRLVESKQILPDQLKNHAVLFGYHRMGHRIGKSLSNLKMQTVIVDFDLEIIEELMSEKRPCIYGDMGDVELLDSLNLRDAKLIISTVPSLGDNKLVINQAKLKKSKAVIIITANDVEDALELYDAGADYVIIPHFLGGDMASLLIERFSLKPGEKKKVRTKHLDELLQKRKMGYDKNVKGHKGGIAVI